MLLSFRPTGGQQKRRTDAARVAYVAVSPASSEALWAYASTDAAPQQPSAATNAGGATGMAGWAPGAGLRASVGARAGGRVEHRQSSWCGWIDRGCRCPHGRGARVYEGSSSGHPPRENCLPRALDRHGERTEHLERPARLTTATKFGLPCACRPVPATRSWPPARLSTGGGNEKLASRGRPSVTPRACVCLPRPR